MNMKLDKILLLGDERLYTPSSPVAPGELDSLMPAIRELHDLVTEYRSVHGTGKAIAAPQIGLMKRIICYRGKEPETIINPELSDLSEELMEVWDDCMSFPGLLVKVKRHRSCTMTYRDREWNLVTWHVEDDLSELFQHEMDHLDGILATQRAIDSRSFRISKS